MKNIYEVVQLIIPVISIGTIIWQIAELKSAIYKYVDSSLASRDIRLNQLEKDFAISMKLLEERKEFIDYQIHGLNESLAHKYNRCMDEIKKIALK